MAGYRSGKQTMRKKIVKKRYIAALVLTLAFFIIGILLGSLISNSRIRFLQDTSDEQRLDFESLQTQYLYVSLLDQQNNCNAVEETFKSNIENLEKTRLRLEEYMQSAKFNEKSFSLLKREYTLAQLRYWLLATSTKDICGRDFVTVLYFYATEEECPTCHSQEMILNYLKKVFKDDLLIFALDSHYDETEPMIKILKSVYKISTYPTLIIDDMAFEGLSSKDDILDSICPLYVEDKEECNVFS